MAEIRQLIIFFSQYPRHVRWSTAEVLEMLKRAMSRMEDDCK